MAKSKKKPRFLFKLLTTPKGLLLCLLLSLFLFNFAYQIYKKPFEVLGAIYSGESFTSKGTWLRYSEDFVQYSTDYVAPETLASIAQIESSGRSWASPQWKWKFSQDWRQIFAPASSAFGLMQLTNGHVLEVDKYCISDRKLIKNCKLSWFYSRLFPSHSIELAAIYLHKTILKLKKTFKRRFSESQLTRVAAVIHLCGKNRAYNFVKRGLITKKGEMCGSHSLRTYISKVEKTTRHLKSHFANSMLDKSN